jgi:hypothetical protein
VLHRRPSRAAPHSGRNSGSLLLHCSGSGMGAESEGNARRHGQEAVEGMRRRNRGAGIGGGWRCTAAGLATAEGAHGALQPPAAGTPAVLQS